MEILLVSGIILITLLPVYLYTRSRLLTFSAAGLYVIFLVVYRDFLFGRVGAWHDAFQHPQLWFSIADHWLASGNAFEWNPYLSAGIPMALYSNYYLWSPVFIFSKVLHSLDINLGQIAFFNLAWLGLFFGFVSGMILFIQELLRRKSITLFALAAILFGGAFGADLGEGVTMLISGVLPYLMFLALRFYRSGNFGYLFFFSLLYGISVNQYIPTYNFLVLFMLLAGCLIFYGRRVIPRLRVLFAAVKIKGALLCCAAFLAAASPAIYSYSEMQDYVSPSRAMAKGCAFSHQTLKRIPVPVNVPLKSYLKLIDGNNINTDIFSTHWPFYLGVVPALLFLYGLTLAASRAFTLTGVSIVIFGLGLSTPIWPWIVSHIPLISMTRQIFMFSRPASFAYLFICLYGLKGIANPGLNPKPKIILIAAGLFICLFTGKITGVMRPAILFASWAVLVWMALQARKFSLRQLTLPVFILLFLHAFDLGLYSLAQSRVLSPTTKAHFLPFDYPNTWVSTCDKNGSWLTYNSSLTGVPFEVRPITRKDIVWTHPQAAYVFLLQKDFADFIYNTGIPSKMGMKGDVFILLPAKSVDNLPRDDFYPLRLADFPLEFFSQIRTSSNNSPEEEGLNTIDFADDTFWRIADSDKGGKQGNWIEFSFPFSIKLDSLLIRPRQDADEFWHASNARLQVAGSNEAWLDVMPLQAFAQDRKQPFAYDLASPVNCRKLRLFIDDPDFRSIAGVELLDRGRISAVKSVKDAGALAYHPSTNPSRAAIAVGSLQDTCLLRLENFHRNWRVYIDGKRGRIERIPPNFQMVRVPAGLHELVFEFHSAYPALLNLHLLLAVFGWLAFIIFLAWKYS